MFVILFFDQVQIYHGVSSLLLSIESSLKVRVLPGSMNLDFNPRLDCDRRKCS